MKGSGPRFGLERSCVNPECAIAARNRNVRGTKVKVWHRVGFPLGATLPQVEIMKPRKALSSEAQESTWYQNRRANSGQGSG